MNPEIKEQWTTALRSGEYKQGKGHLHQKGENGLPDTYCCLGVLCDLAVNVGATEKVFGADLGSGYEYRQDLYFYGRQPAVLPNEVQEWAELETDAGISPDGTIQLTALNDTGSTFAEIADIIEREF